MALEYVSFDDVRVPRFLYGTAWKEESTQGLTELAVRQGFRGIDTANQRRHYHEAAVGQAVASLTDSGLLTREDLFLQTKFTFQASQDHRVPYDPRAPIDVQVQQSLTSSLEHLGVGAVDSLLLHGPSQQKGMGDDDWAAWNAMEAACDGGRARLLGISNVNLQQIEQLHHRARIKPSFVQNRCFAATAWDQRVRDFCKANGIVYQGFSLLSANRSVLHRPELASIARSHGRSVNQIIFRFAIDVGMIPLTGTSNAEHMRQDLEVFDFALERREIDVIERLASS